jgi:ABC-2 type transport system permease protein
VEFVDPHESRDAEEEAARYGVRPVPFQVASRHQAGVVSSYFDIVVAYGDEHETLGYRDLIEVKVHGEGELDVVLKNPEYAITRAIRKVHNAYRAGGSPFDSVKAPVTFHGYVSPHNRLPEELQTLREELLSVLDELKQQAGDKLTVSFADPDANGGALARELQEKYGFGPQVASLLDPQPFWFYMVLESGEDAVPVPLPESFDRDGLSRSLEAAVRRLAPGFLKTVAVAKPEVRYGPQGKRYEHVMTALAQNARIRETDLKDGRVPAEADLLVVLAPEHLDDKQRFAIDQFLMQAGSVVLATSPFDMQIAGNLTANKHTSGLEEWLQHHGITLDDSMVLDPHNAALPVPVQRYIGAMSVREIRMLPYPHFPDLRGDSLNPDSPVTADLSQLTLNWASPVTVDTEKNRERRVIELLKSSPGSWTSDSLEVVPDYKAHPQTGFAVSGERGPRTMAVALEGRFESFYKGKDSPLAAAAEASAAADEGNSQQGAFGGVIDRSPESARLVLIASNTFASDAVIGLASEAIGTIYTKPVEFLQNAVDWSLEDSGLLALRGRTQLARTLAPLSAGEQMFWEYLNYGLAFGGLALVWGWRRLVRRADQARYQQILAEV